MKMKLVIDTDNLLKRLEAAGNVGCDLSPGDPLALEAAACIRELLPRSGTGECICQMSPEARERHIESWGDKERKFAPNMLLDHRCAIHGEKAQPALWGRHKELELVVTDKQWKSLGVSRAKP